MTNLTKCRVQGDRKNRNLIFFSCKCFQLFFLDKVRKRKGRRKEIGEY
jgi:hypothetical protein